MDEDEPGKPICAVGEDKWEKIQMTMDSATYKTVIPKSIGKAFSLQETLQSKRGQHFRAANGTIIKNYGQRSLRGMTKEWNGIGIKAQVADVTKPLASARELKHSGNRIVILRRYRGLPSWPPELAS